MRRLQLLGLFVIPPVAVGCAAVKDDPSFQTSTLTVFAAASLSEVFSELGREFEAQHPGTTVAFNFGPSSTLALQVANGSPADVLVTADETTMQPALDAGVMSSLKGLARNRLAILVGQGNPKDIRALDDLARPGLIVALCAPEVPCGRLANQVLTKAGVAVVPKSHESDVKAVVTKVSLGEADAGIVYVTDAKAASATTEGIAIPSVDNVTTTYVIATRTEAEAGTGARTAKVRLAEAFADYVRSASAQKVLMRAGFEAP